MVKLKADYAKIVEIYQYTPLNKTMKNCKDYFLANGYDLAYTIVTYN